MKVVSVNVPLSCDEETRFRTDQFSEGTSPYRTRPARKYEVMVGTGLLKSAGELISKVTKAEKIAVVTDDTVDTLYAGAFEENLQAAGFQTVKFSFLHGEERKNGTTFLDLLNFLAENEITRTDALVALGGGVVGDLAGFAAASYLRGIDYIQVPTTLLSQVDSSVGGKTAIDLEAGKNLAGAFYHPKLVICDCATLDTLTSEVFTDGCAEVIKYGILGDEKLFGELWEKGQDFEREDIIGTCVEIKALLVEKDERDVSERRLLNLGHTLGHAVEARSGFAVPHGKAVAIGMATVARAAAKQGLCSGETAGGILEVLEKFGLPTTTDYSIDELLPHMLSDKKRTGAVMHVIVPKKLGECGIVPMELPRLRDFMASGL